QNKELNANKLSPYILDNENNEIIKYNKIFDERKINELLEEAIEKMEYANENDIEFFKQDSELLIYISFLTIKYFTHLKDELENSSLEDDISALGSLLSTGLFKKILNDVFDGNEVHKVYDVMTEHIEGSAKALEVQAKMQQETFNMVQSPTIKSKLQNTETYRNVLS